MVNVKHFSAEFGEDVSGGAGTCVNELYRASGPETEFIHLTGHPETWAAAERVKHIGLYDMDVINKLDFDAAIFHYYGLSCLTHDSVLRGRSMIFAVHSVPTTEPWSLLDPYGGNDAVAGRFERMCDRADRIVCVSEAERGKLLLLYPDLEPKARVIYNGIAGSFAEPKAAPAGHRTRFGFLGRCDYRKGLREALAAFRFVEGELWIACGAEDAAYRIEAELDARRFGLDSRVRWLDRLDEAGKAAFFADIDALLVPSRWEPFGYVVLEALRAGVPPIIGSRGGMKEIVGEQYRYQFDPYDTDSMIQCILDFQKDSAETVQTAATEASRRAKRLTAAGMAEQYVRTAQEIAVSERLPEIASKKLRHAGADAADAWRLCAAADGHASATPKRDA
ncbi:glycosyltransferase family 4 protein [Paenibacillus thermotolerans]|uniref:glycosyltransferase family 4 protein n=1 Tax=Paenibacillus thermotolerans TaxID=3027807 RepID=UPI002368194F|nr:MULTISPECIES: glycosyltransferase family 4 protein [unclassified Paenibacillus]